MWRNQYFYLAVVLFIIATVFYPTLDRDMVYWVGGKVLGEVSAVSWLNLALHLANVMLVYLFTFLVFRKPLLAAAISLLWGIHPIHADTVAWVVRQNDLLSWFAYLLSLSSYLLYARKGEQQKQWLFYGFSMALFGVSAYFQRFSLIAPLAFFLLDFLEKRKLQKELYLDKLPLVLFIVVSWYFGIHSSQVQVSNDVLPFFQKLWLGGYAIGLYVAKFFVPIGLTLMNPFSASLLSKAVLLFGAFVALGLLALFVLGIVRKKVLINDEFTFGMLFFLVHLLPSLVLPLEGYFVWAAYKAYLPYIGLCYAMVGLYYFFAKQANLVITTALVSILVLSFGYLSWQRTTVWKSTLSLLTEVIEKYPEDELANFLRGNIYLKKKAYEVALKDLDKANLRQPDAMTTFLMGHTLYRLRDYKTSITAYENAAAMQPDLANTFRYNMDMAVNKSFGGDMKKAKEFLDKAEKLATDNALRADYLYGCGLCCTAVSQYDMAVQNYIRAIEINPSMVEAYKNIGGIKIYGKKTDEAIAYLKKAEVLTPYDKGVLEGLINCYTTKKDSLKVNYYTQRYNLVLANEKKQ